MSILNPMRGVNLEASGDVVRVAESVDYTKFRLNCVALTRGAVAYRMSGLWIG